ncbi:RmlC-like cupin domain-containing protein, partial [Powellomyces hirtus]
SLPALSATLHEALETAGLASPDISISHITTLLQRYTAPDYHPFAHHDPSKPYTRTLLDDGNGFFNLMLLVWTPGAGSPVHDHAGSHCLMKVLDGELAETLYAVPDAHDHPTHDERVDSGNEDSVDEGEPKGIRVRKNARLAVGDVAYIHDKIGLHKISNPSPSQHAVSLHLYTPPFEYCKTYCERTGEARASGKCVFY